MLEVVIVTAVVVELEAGLWGATRNDQGQDEKMTVGVREEHRRWNSWMSWLAAVPMPCHIIPESGSHRHSRHRKYCLAPHHIFSDLVGKEAQVPASKYHRKIAKRLQLRPLQLGRSNCCTHF